MSFIGNAISGVGNAIGGLLGGGSAQRGQNQATQAESDALKNQNRITGTYADAFQQDYHPVLQSYLQQNGFDTKTGAFDPNFDPQGGTGPSSISAYREAAAPQYDNAVNSAEHDLIGRGFSGANSVTPEVVSGIRTQQASDNANFTRNLGVQSNQMRYQDMANALNAITGTGVSAQQGYGQAAQGYGNIAGQYGQQQAQSNQGLAGLASAIGSFVHPTQTSR